MKTIKPRNNRFYLSRRLIMVLAMFIVAASILVVLTSFSLNMISASRDFTSLLTQWNQQHYQSVIAIERYSRNGDLTDYRVFLDAVREQDQYYQPIQELLMEDPNAELIFRSFDHDVVYPNEISALILASRLYSSLESVEGVRNNWRQLQSTESQRHNLARQMRAEWESGNAASVLMEQYRVDMNRLNQQWSRQNRILLAEVGRASLGIKRFGLWLSVILGILLVLIGIVVSVRVNKSIGRWNQSLHEKEVLLAEVHHRVKNNLAIISGLLELESTQDRDPRMALRESRDRIRSMALIHEIMYRSDSFAEIELDTYIGELAEHFRKSYGGSETGITLSTGLEKVFLNINQAIPVGLICNELLSSSKEPAESGDRRITIRLAETEGEVRLSLLDSAGELPTSDDFEQQDKMTLTIIKALVQQLKADLVFPGEPGSAADLIFQKSDASGSGNARL